MGFANAPALPLAVGMLAGVALARLGGGQQSAGAFGWGVAALVVALCLPRPVALMVGAGGVGWMVTSLMAPVPLQPTALDLERPLTITGRTSGRWRRSELGWSARLTVTSTRQGDLEVSWPEEVLLLLPALGEPPAGPELRARGLLFRPHRLANGVPGRPPIWRLACKSKRLVDDLSARLPGARAPPWKALRRLAQAAVEREEHPRGTAIARALVLGDPSSLPREWVIALRRAGLGHLLAVSGLHVGLAMSIAWTASLCLRPGHRTVLCLIALLGYVVVVGERPSLVRSALMAGLVMASLASERKPQLLNAWAVSITLMTLGSPRIIEDLGFQLTAAATLGILVLAPAMRRRMMGIPDALAVALATSVAAHVATLPWSLVVFRQWTPLAVLLNLVAVPWTALTLATALAAVCLGWVDGLGDALWALLDRLAAPFGWLATIPVRVGGSRTVVTGWGAALVAATLLTTATLCRRPAWSLLAGALGVLVIVPPQVARSAASIVVLDVGQGEAVLLRDGAAATLVDGGGGLTPGLATREVAPALRRLGIGRLTEVVSTHPDLDHCAGLVELSLLMPIGGLRAAPGWEEPCYRQLIRRFGIRYRPVWSGARWNVGRWSLEVLHPSPGERGGGNERSMVIRARHGALSLLLTGDLGHAGERRLLRSAAERLPSGVLKLGHHGSRGSTHQAFLRQVAPRIALVSSGRGNVYGHPSDEVLERLSRQEVPTWRTDVGGQIVVEHAGSGRWRVRQPWSRAKGSASTGEMSIVVTGLVESSDAASRRHRRPDGRGKEPSGSQPGGPVER